MVHEIPVRYGPGDTGPIEAAAEMSGLGSAGAVARTQRRQVSGLLSWVPGGFRLGGLADALRPSHVFSPRQCPKRRSRYRCGANRVRRVDGVAG